MDKIQVPCWSNRFPKSKSMLKCFDINSKLKYSTKPEKFKF